MPAVVVPAVVVPALVAAPVVVAAVVAAVVVAVGKVGRTSLSPRMSDAWGPPNLVIISHHACMGCHV